ncbi:MAG: hypothetical protein BVN29_08915 [Nitrospira sp. ST-bin5]|nr:MAG: hypothetical protein BVN29_08915 [Nitrospira sp. ST-bin5]
MGPHRLKIGPGKKPLANILDRDLGEWRADRFSCPLSQPKRAMKIGEIELHGRGSGVLGESFSHVPVQTIEGDIAGP